LVADRHQLGVHPGRGTVELRLKPPGTIARLGVSTFEIWNEPNIARSFGPSANVGTYKAMLKAADRQIKRANCRATVVTGGLSPSPSNRVDLSPMAFLRGIYRHGGRRFFNDVGMHPYCWPAYPAPTIRGAPGIRSTGPGQACAAS
jgi:hypothetical protein